MTVVDRLAKVREQLHRSLELAGRSCDEVELLVVTKTFPVEVIQQVVDAGEQLLGENRVQEALEKQNQLPSHISWHLIGPLQRNKVRKVVGKFTCLQGIDSLKLAGVIDRIAGELGVTQPVLLQVKVGGEETKSGFEFSHLLEQMEFLTALTNISIEGLMTIPPPVKSPLEARPFFAAVRELRDQLQLESGLPLKELSMGMSSDYQAAIAEGSTMVRIGSAIFGER